MLSGVTHIALKLPDLIVDQQIKDAVAVRTAKPAVFYKIIIAGATGRTDDLTGLFFLRFLPRHS